MFFPSTHPNSRKASEKLAANSGLNGPALRTPIVYLFPACCARAASGHVAAAQLSAAINSSRLNGFSSGRGSQPTTSLSASHHKALFVQGDGFFTSQRVQFAALAKHHGIATAFANREFVEAGGLMSYGTDIADMFHQVGVYTG